MFWNTTRRRRVLVIVIVRRGDNTGYSHSCFLRSTVMCLCSFSCACACMYVCICIDIHHLCTPTCSSCTMIPYSVKAVRNPRPRAPAAHFSRQRMDQHHRLPRRRTAAYAIRNACRAAMQNRRSRHLPPPRLRLSAHWRSGLVAEWYFLLSPDLLPVLLSFLRSFLVSFLLTMPPTTGGTMPLMPIRMAC